jgi:hypothetical protein
VSGPALPPAACACVSLIANTSRRGRGRCYLAGMTESQWGDTGLSVAASNVAIGAAWLAFTNQAGSTASLVPAVYSRADGVSRLVTSIAVDSRLDTQRRRQARVAT